MASRRVLVRVVGKTDDVRGLGEDLLDGLRDEAWENIQIGQGMLADAIRDALSHPSSDPAAPGEPPRKVKGGLQKSWKPGRFGWANAAQTIMRGAVESYDPAAGPLEYGSPAQGIAAHPYVRPTVARIARDLAGVLTQGDAYWGKRATA